MVLCSQYCSQWMAPVDSQPEKQKGACPYLHLNIQNTHEPLGRHVLDGLDACAVAVSRELGVLDEGALGHEGLKGLARGKVVLDAVGLAGAGEAGCVFFFFCQPASQPG